MAKKAVDPIKAKQAKQKKIAIGGAVVLVLLFALQGPKLLKRLHGGGASATPQWLIDSRNAGGGAPAPAGGVSLAAPSLAGANPAAGPVVAAPTGLAAADAQPTASAGQLASFSRFASKDPFAAQVTSGGAGTLPTPPAPPTPTVGGGSGNGVPSAPGGGTTVPAPPTPKQTYSSAVIAVNGTFGNVGVGMDFGTPIGQPDGKPLFHLLSVTAHTAKIAIAGGSYADGASAITLREGKSLTLQNTADGTRYTIRLYPQGTPLPATTGGTSTASAPAGTTQSGTTTGDTTTGSNG